MADTSFHLGDHVDPATGERRNEPVDYEAAERLDTADDRLAMEREQLLDLENDLARDVAGIGDRWDAAANQVEEIAIGLERSDVRVEPMKLLWLPVDGGG